MHINARRCVMAAGLLLFGAAGCGDLEVAENPNAPNTRRVLATAGDVESLIAGSFRQVYRANNTRNVGTPLSVVAFEHSSMAANFGNIFYSTLPRSEIINDPSAQFYSLIANPWIFSYRGIAAASDGLRALDADMQADLGAERTRRAQAWAKFVQGWGHATLALLYDSAFVVDEKSDLSNLTTQPYQEVLAAALGYWDEALGLIQPGMEFPSSWGSRPITGAQLTQVIHSLRARHRAANARNPTERAAVDWAAVLADAQAGVTEDFLMDIDHVWKNWQGWDLANVYSHAPGTWAFLNYMITGMADQSGNYQRWINLPIGQRSHLMPPDETPMLIVTPDTRYPQGTTLAQQRANPGSQFIAPTNLGSQIARPERGTWRWSLYRLNPAWTCNRAGNWFWEACEPLMEAEITAAEVRLLRAEAHLRMGGAGLAQAAALINVSRTEHGLSPADAAGTNLSCVPKLPSGTCGDLMEMLKWEKRHEAWSMGLMQAPWYFEGRGWGDLYAGTFTQLPIPALEREVVGAPSYTRGGPSDPTAAGPSVYAWPHEGT